MPPRRYNCILMWVVVMLTFISMMATVLLFVAVILDFVARASNVGVSGPNKFTALVPDSMITSAPTLITAVERDAPMTDCDGVGSFFCQTGTCYTGYDGFVGCCSVKSCAARTTCLPYTANLKQTCDQNTGGCVVCSAENPLCVTITNIVASQYIMYCNTKSLGVVTYSYENLISTGSMASAPSTAMTTKAISTSVAKASPAISTTAAEGGSPTRTTSVTPTGTDSVYPALSGGALIGLVVGLCIFVLFLLGCATRLFWKKKNDRKYTNSAEGQLNGQGGFSRERNKSTVSLTGRRKLQKQNRNARSNGNIVTTHANNADDFISPIESERLALESQHRDIAGVFEMSTPDNSRQSADQQGWWEPPTTSAHQDASPSARWSGSNKTSVTYKAYSPNINQSNHVSELSTIRQVRSSGEIQLDVADAASAFSPVSSVDQFSPAMSATGFTPTPLMPQNRNFDRASVGQSLALSATVDGPLNWPSRQRFAPSNSARASNTSGMSRSLTSATGGGSPYVSAEATMAGELGVGVEEENENEV